MAKRNKGGRLVFEKLAQQATKRAGSPLAFTIALGVVLVWVMTGPLFGFSDTWQLVINTGTTIVTFLMVFLIQHTQNKDTQAIELKLNEIVAAIEGASNRLIAVEELTSDELTTLQSHYRTLASLAAKETLLTKSHSIEEAENRHRQKKRKSA
jgi:low affinity Fe/Cu permease